MRRVSWGVWLAVVVSGAGLASRAAAASPQQGVVAHSASEIPAEWTAMTPKGTCLANPWGDGCPPVREVQYPPVSQLRAELNSPWAPVSEAPTTVVSSDGAALRATVSSQAPPSTARPAEVAAACDLTVYRPNIITVAGNHIAHGTSTVQCPTGYSYAEVTSDLFRSGTLLDVDTGADLFPPLFATATASDDCRHQDARPYTNRGFAFVERPDGSADSDSATASANHTCPD